MRRRALAALLLAVSGAATAQVWRSDQGDGSYRNPVLYADYPDPDVIRVGRDYYFVSTTFVNVPGITILHSRDLINWTIATHVATELDGDPRYDLVGGNAYRKGLYAASLRHHDGTFYLAITPVGQKTRIYYAKSIRGPWRYHELDREAFDPGLFIEPDGRAYLATATTADGTITLLTLDRTLSKVTDARKIHYIKGAEGSKLIRRGDYYYLFNALPPRLALSVSRSHSLFGPWETRDQIDDRSGGHQGALVDLPGGAWFGFVMEDSGAIGRMTNFSPVFWENDWPVWGTPAAPGRVPARARKPIAGGAFAEPPSSDTFDRLTLGVQWQWNHNPDERRWSLTERPGWLRLRPTRAARFWEARNTLTQKGQGPASRGEVVLDLAHLAPGDRCGFGTLGQVSANLTATRGADGRASLAMEVTEDQVEGARTETRATVPLSGNRLWLRTEMDFKTSTGRVAYSEDGRRWRGLGGDFPLRFAWRTGTFQGEQFALFCYAPGESKGWVDVDSFTLSPVVLGEGARP
ncbi:glycoside hydrolase 43 family protein [Sphingomonas sp. RRHST34]|uniref:Glycoside hydrolase 43 family protein n=1 Tax=Sphingomonas citri TaxID=2862499 RepID=A0ABS7BMZ8_9SPHN|nr:glycoside hydrolase 43 family protein [Sphingomonas citri]MBW6530847.1 glycoside hydrolase 43 family protein [Sphingomonas citri]